MSLNKNLWIFDIDGTLANNEHRQHHLLNGKREWNEFFAKQHLDEPYEPVFELLRMLIATGNKCIIITGRMENHRQDSLEWIWEHYGAFNADDLIMRPNGDQTEDDELKWNITQKYLNDNPELKLVALFDDRHRIIDKFREHGVYVFECNQKRMEF